MIWQTFRIELNIIRFYLCEKNKINVNYIQHNVLEYILLLYFTKNFIYLLDNL